MVAPWAPPCGNRCLRSEPPPLANTTAYLAIRIPGTMIAPSRNDYAICLSTCYNLSNFASAVFVKCDADARESAHV